MAFLDAFRKRMRHPYQTPGFAGGYLLDDEPQDQSDYDKIWRLGAPQESRPRYALPGNISDEDVGIAFEEAKRTGNARVSPDVPFQSPFKERFSQTRPRIADPTTFDATHLRELEAEPLGWREKFGMVAQNIATNLGYKPLPTRRQRDLEKLSGRVERGIALDKHRMAREQGQMVPVTLEDGSTVVIPAKSAGTLQSQQQRIRQQGEEGQRRRELDKARVAHWGNMDSASRKRLILGEYNSGMLNTPELLEYAADELGLSGPIREKFVTGQLRDAIDENGNLIQVNRQTGAVTQGPQSYETVKEEGRNRRAAAAQIGANQRAGMRGQGMTRKITPAERRDIAETAAVVNSVHRRLTALDDQIKAEKDPAKLAGLQNKRKEIVEEGALQADKLNRIDPDNEWGSGTGGYPYTKPKTQSAPSQGMGRTIEGAINAFKTKYKREPTTDEVARMKAALGQ